MDANVGEGHGLSRPELQTWRPKRNRESTPLAILQTEADQYSFQ
jgi:hypothetical protein